MLRLAVAMSLGDVGAIVKCAGTIQRAKFEVSRPASLLLSTSSSTLHPFSDSDSSDDESTTPPSPSLSISSFVDLLSSHDITFNLSFPSSLITTYPVSLPSKVQGYVQETTSSHVGFCTGGDKEGYLFANDTLTVFETGYHGGLKGVSERSQQNMTKVRGERSEERRPGGGLSSAITNNASSARRFAPHRRSPSQSACRPRPPRPPSQS